ncbi:MAG: T9SS type A sorting domain-containing protein [Calditrichaeota bacterium]|nr:T9SS type A sorting domain-containing protein [Calditrichota bacterium]
MTIQIELAEPAVVSVRMYDLVGRRVATVVEGRPLPARVHRFTWHGNDDAGRALPSGVYFCRVQAGNRWRVQKVVKAR